MSQLKEEISQFLDKSNKQRQPGQIKNEDPSTILSRILDAKTWNTECTPHELYMLLQAMCNFKLRYSFLEYKL